MRVWCCVRCGRWGVRGFTFAPNDDKARVCVNDAACARRADTGSSDSSPSERHETMSNEGVI